LFNSQDSKAKGKKKAEPKKKTAMSNGAGDERGEVEQDPFEKIIGKSDGLWGLGQSLCLIF
jgi:hypothetical protein